MKPWDDWQQIDQTQVNAAINLAEKRGKSFCNALLRDGLRLSHEQYRDVKDRFDDASMGDLTGVYAAANGNRVALLISM